MRSVCLFTRLRVSPSGIANAFQVYHNDYICCLAQSQYTFQNGPPLFIAHPPPPHCNHPLHPRTSSILEKRAPINALMRTMIEVVEVVAWRPTRSTKTLRPRLRAPAHSATRTGIIYPSTQKTICFLLATP